MTEKKKLKQAIRARARKTGESYTAARRMVLEAKSKKSAAGRPRSAPTSPSTAKPSPTRAAVTDAAVRRKTGHGLDHWFDVLDRFGTTHGHTKAADHLCSVHGVPGWHAQGITVSWERARGLRVENQSCTGKFQVSVSKTVPVTVADVARAFSDRRRRSAWLREAPPELARALEGAFAGAKPREVKVKDANYARLRYPWDGCAVEVYMYGKPTGTSVVASNNDLPEHALVEERRRQWRRALEALKAHLAG